MWNGLRAPALHRSAAAEPQQPEVRVEGQDGQKRDQRQCGQAALQELIKGETEHIEPGIDAEERIGQPKGSAITKAEIRIPLRIEDERKEQSADSSDRAHGQFQNRGRDPDAEFRGNGRLACQITRTESGAVSRRKAKIDPEVQKPRQRKPRKTVPTARTGASRRRRCSRPAASTAISVSSRR